MDPIKSLENEHEDIERELIEFEAIMDSDVVNYPNLVHVFKRFCSLWEAHEEKEEMIFGIMNRGHLTIPVEQIRDEHEDLKKHLMEIKGAINSGDDYRVRKCFDSDLKVLIGKIREHVGMEDEILYTVSPKEFSKSELSEMERLFVSYSGDL